MKTLIEKIAGTVQAMNNCIAVKNEIWEHRHRETISQIEANDLPSGSGINSVCEIDLRSKGIFGRTIQRSINK
jgi:hypothetical protein